MKEKKVLLVGNPNVGKSTLFNALTGMNQHTGNWTGKTIDFEEGCLNYKNIKLSFIDLPGTYSIDAYSKEEEVTRDYILNEKYDLIIVVCDAITISRSLKLLLQVLNNKTNVIMTINLIDEALKKGIFINFKKIEHTLNIPVIPICAKNKQGFENLLEVIINYKNNDIKINYNDINIKDLVTDCVKYSEKVYSPKERKIDKILTNKSTGIPIMILLLFFVLWLTIWVSNYPSIWLFDFFNYWQVKFFNILNLLKIPPLIIDMMVNGIYKTVSWIISVMLPPMVIFFLLFTLLEDYGILPRISFNMDNMFSKCGTCGKQCLTMLMGFGCNAVGVSGTRIFESKKEKIIAILTNVFVPCNGRFPTIIAMINIFFIGFTNSFLSSFFKTIILTLIILISIIITFIISKFMAKFLLKKSKSSFILELPHYRRPNILTIIKKSLFDRTLFILGKTITISIPAGIILYLVANYSINDITMLNFIANKLNKVGLFLGIDGMILIAFILGFPANEIVVPILLMGYLKGNNLIDYENLNFLKNILIDNGWTILTAINFIVLTIFHFPCSTTFLTIKKETGSLGWSLFSIILPLTIGIILCLIIKCFWQLFIL